MTFFSAEAPDLPDFGSPNVVTLSNILLFVVATAGVVHFVFGMYCAFMATYTRERFRYATSLAELEELVEKHLAYLRCFKASIVLGPVLVVGAVVMSVVRSLP
ncbi:MULTISPECIES: hypothetical protein [unclassified Leucobacter]|uniref:hypothetical protein n=1 Tax=unclassified Leucobacter TaxID=2621730 RepID=UPI00301AB11D